ncbi:hypothetical protein V8V91_19085 [Algoriphagus halophilus]|uniref:hypothetical protein n=1 Tax=Algoriphagus halophilus TaxID=226505 RepID=UPI00358F91AA
MQEKKRNPTLQRIKRIMGYPAQTYPQNPIISIPMLITLILSAGLIASAQQDVPAKTDKVEPIAQVVVKNTVEKLVPKVIEATKDTVDKKVEKVIITDGFQFG